MKKKIIFGTIIFTIICCVYLIKITNSRYISKVNIDGNIDVAVPQIVLDVKNYSDSFTLLPGQTQELEFSIKNYNDLKINEVLMEYYIKINTTKLDLPLEYELYEVSSTNEKKLTANSQGFGPITLNYGNQEEKKYKLKFSWDENDNKISYVNKQYSFQILAETIEIYKQTQKCEEIVFKSKEYSNLTATIANVSTIADVENTFDITVTNPNDYEVKYKIIEENDLYKVEYSGTSNTNATIAANSTETIRVIFSGKDDVIYEDMLADSSGNLYKIVTIVLDAINPYDAEQVQIATNQIIYLEKSIKNKIIATAGEIRAYEEGYVFSGASSSSESALCSIADPVSGETIYFYRGAVDNNYVSFAGYTWRILRINSDGSLRLILDDIATTTQYQSSNTPTENTINSAISLLDWENSAPYSALNTWYNSNISTNYGDKVVETQFVFDTSYDETTSSSAGACYYFGPYLRVGSDANLFSPTFSYTEDTVVTDKIGLITADELLYAGAYFRTTNTSFFLYNSSITTSCWTMSPSFWDNSAHYKAGMIILDSDGKMHDWPNSGNTLTESLGLRPVISIRGDIEMSGSGTKTDPFKYK